MIEMSSRIDSIPVRTMSLEQMKQVPSQIFQEILNEKMNALPAGVSLGKREAAAATANEILVQDTFTGNESNLNNIQTLAQSTGVCLQCYQEQQAGTNQTYNTSLNGTPTATGLSDSDLEKAAPYMQYINEASERYGMPVNLILGIMKAESNFNNECVSYAGAKGLMQLMPETAAEVGVTDVFDSRQNILGSVEYVTKLINRYDGDVRLALAAYNTGPGKIARRGVTSSTSEAYLTVPQSIRDYADRVLRYAGYQD